MYLLIGAGFLCAKWVHIKKEDIGNLIIYIISPIVVFTSVLEMDLTLSRLSLPLLFTIVCISMGSLAFLLGRYLLKPSYRGILAFATGSGNAGFFGIPLVIYLIGNHAVGVAILCTLGFITYEYSFGFYYAARGHYSSREAIVRVLKLPNLYALFAAVILNLLGNRLPESFVEVSHQFRGAYSVLGMMLVGLGVGSIKKWRINLRFLCLGYLFRSVLWPLLFLFVIYLDTNFWHFFDEVTRKVMLIMALVPLPAISVAIATTFDTEPEDTAVLIISHTLFVIFYIPLFLILAGQI